MLLHVCTALLVWCAVLVPEIQGAGLHRADHLDVSISPQQLTASPGENVSFSCHFGMREGRHGGVQQIKRETANKNLENGDNVYGQEKQTGDDVDDEISGEQKLQRKRKKTRIKRGSAGDIVILWSHKTNDGNETRVLSYDEGWSNHSGIWRSGQVHKGQIAIHFVASADMTGVYKCRVLRASLSDMKEGFAEAMLNIDKEISSTEMSSTERSTSDIPFTSIRNIYTVLPTLHSSAPWRLNLTVIVISVLAAILATH